MSDGHLQAVVDTVFMLIFPHQLLLLNLTKQFWYSQLLHISPLRVFLYLLHSWPAELTDDTSVQCDYYHSHHRNYVCTENHHSLFKTDTNELLSPTFLSCCGDRSAPYWTGGSLLQGVTQNEVCHDVHSWYVKVMMKRKLKNTKDD